MAELPLPRMEAFCQFYVAHGNGAKAAREADYATKHADSQAKKLLEKPHVQERIAELRGNVAKANEVDADWLVKNYKRVFDRAMGDETVVDEQEGDEPGQVVKTYKFDSAGAKGALDGIAKITGFDKPHMKERGRTDDHIPIEQRVKARTARQQAIAEGEKDGKVVALRKR